MGWFAGTTLCTCIPRRMIVDEPPRESTARGPEAARRAGPAPGIRPALDWKWML
jgi:hypothetical protein